MALRTDEQNEASALCQLIQDLERQIQQRARQLQKETDRTLQQAEQIGSILQLVREGERRNEKRERRNEKRQTALEQQLEEALKQIEKQDRKLQRAKRREQQSQDEATELEQERDEALQRLQDTESFFSLERRDRIERFHEEMILTEREGRETRRALQQSEERARALEQERDTALQRLQECYENGEAEAVEGEDYIVDEVYDSRAFDGNVKYLVKWEGYPTKRHSTWEPFDHIRISQATIAFTHTNI
ncbi:hypothetical protein E4U33_007513 [Claviceps sp. LM78 group G4]|nr:hypothetical protein E4U33_007513 [Claviceps sp. LM78 group G4]